LCACRHRASFKRAANWSRSRASVWRRRTLVFKQGRQVVFSPAYSILSYITAWQLSLPLFCYCIKLMGTPFLRTYLDFLSKILGSTRFNKYFWVEYASCSTWVG
jgi:hypothetical protein